jgi:CPA1 family monovalent cation:H+ antiporter
MTLFETVLALLLLAMVLLRVSRRSKLPYPTLLALAGACTAALPWAPEIKLDPQLALLLFIAPVLLDAAYDLPPRELLRASVPLTLLAVFAVVLTATAVAGFGWALGGLPLAAALTLGAIVAPPDAAAASAVLQRFDLPRRTLAILQGEGLLNDAVALLLFNAGLSWARPGSAGSAGHWSELLLAAPGGVLLGVALAWVYLRLRPWVAGSLSVTILELVSTFGTWIIAERLHLSPILAVVAFAMGVARRAPEEQTPRDRVQSYAVWGSLVFLLNVLAFLIMGLQARTILRHIEPDRLWRALGFALAVLGLVIVVRMVWVLSSGAIARRLLASKLPRRRHDRLPSVREELLIGWCGMRGLVSLAASFALPSDFPGRELIVLTAFTVVLGTLVIQGLTISPLLSWLEMPKDNSMLEELSSARRAMLRAALQRLAKEPGEAASAMRAEYRSAQTVAGSDAPLGQTEHDHLRAKALEEERRVLMDLRRRGEISDDAFHALEEQLDWAYLGAAPPEHSRILEG